jgi:hypothetical protein
MLPDDVLLVIFDFCAAPYQDLGVLLSDDTKRNIEWWQSLVHVCRRWRCLVFASPRRLNLRLLCIPGTSARSLDVWPALPLFIQGRVTETSVDNVVAELKHSDRICYIDLTCDTTSKSETFCTAMQAPFPELAILYLLFCGSSNMPVLPDSLLGGSAPRLQYFFLNSLPFPGLPKLLLSAAHIVYLQLWYIPHSGYFSPEAMATGLSMLTGLEDLQLGFESPQSCPEQNSQRPPPLTRSVLPTLTSFVFKGVNEYLEELVARIDTPRLNQLSTRFFNDIDFNIPKLEQFIIRTSTLGAYDEAHIIFDIHKAEVLLRPFQPGGRMVEIGILCQVSDWQLSSLAQICTPLFHLFLTMQNLYIYEDLHLPLEWKDVIENTEWLDLLLPFTAVKNLYLSNQISPHIAPALQELTGGRTMEVLPALEKVLLEGFQPSKPTEEGIAEFITARQLTNHPVAISVWNKDES